MKGFDLHLKASEPSLAIIGAVIALFFFLRRPVEASDNGGTDGGGSDGGDSGTDFVFTSEVITAYQSLVQQYQNTADEAQQWLDSLQSKQSHGVVQVSEMAVSSSLRENYLNYPVQTLEVYNVGPGSMKFWVNDLADSQTLSAGQSNKISFAKPIISQWSHQLVDSAVSASMRVITTR